MVVRAEIGNAALISDILLKLRTSYIKNVMNCPDLLQSKKSIFSLNDQSYVSS